MPGGELIGDRYRLEGRIATGGMGQVWRGTDLRLNRKVAIKLLHGGLSSNSDFRARFASEATLVAALNVPGVATIHDYGEDDEGETTRSYLVMELVDGRSLAEVIRERGALPVGEAMRIVAEAAEGLHAAHEAGIIHRDVKPANILIAADGSVKLIDFGIARALGEAGLTETGMMIGTVTYTSPEQFADEDPAPAADIYSLGVVAYECLSGTPPFVSDKAPAIMNGHLNLAPPPLPDHVPDAVSDAVLKALLKAPAERWETVREFGRACRDAFHVSYPGQPERPSPVAALAIMPEESGVETEIVAVPEAVEPKVETRELTGARPTRRRALVTAAAVLAVVGLAAALVFSSSWRQPPGRDATGVRGIDLGSFVPSFTSPSGEPAVEDSGPRDEKPPGEKDPKPPPGETEPGDGDGDDPGGDDDPTTAKVPDLNGVPTADAAARLRAYGFENSKGVAEQDWQGATCVVTRQTPEPGKVVDLGTEITYYYIDTYYPPCTVEESAYLPGLDGSAPVLSALWRPRLERGRVSRDRAAVAPRRSGARTRR